MARPALEHPTELELQILKILWRQGPLPVRGVREGLASGPARRKLAHTSVITILNIMVRKKYLRRTKKGKAYIFHPRVTQDGVTHGMLHDSVDRVFDGSAATVMLKLLDTADIDQHELERLRQLIEHATEEHY